MRQYLLQGYAVLPIVGDPFVAVNLRNQVALVGGRDPTTVLEAASAVLAEIESERHHLIAQRLVRADQNSYARWMRHESGASRKAGPLHPLAVLAATNLAMAYTSPSGGSENRDDAAVALCRVATQYNSAATQGTSAEDDDAVLASMAMSMLWKAMLDEAWTVWSAELVAEVMADPTASDVLDAFERNCGLTLLEWQMRALGERATRRVQGAGAFHATEQVDPDLEKAWLATVTITPEEVAAEASGLLASGQRRRPSGLIDPAALGWLARRPVIGRADGARWALWLGGLDYALLPATVATRLAALAEASVDRTSSIMGNAAGRLLAAHIEASPAVRERRIPEHKMPSKHSKCDYLLETEHTLVGIEFTVARPPASLATGRTAGLDRLVPSLAAKVRQAHRTMNRWDPDDAKRKLPLVVFGSPNVVAPLINLRVHDALVAEGETSGEPELMTCHAPEFHDLVHHAANSGIPLAEAILDWRDSKHGGADLDWWLAERNALRTSTKHRMKAALDGIEPVLTRGAR